MKLIGVILMVIFCEYVFGCTESNSTSSKTRGGDIEMKISIMAVPILPESFGETNIDLPSITADDMIKTISALDNRFDYQIYREFNERYIIIATIKGQSDTMLDIQYMSLNNIKSWYNDKLDEALGRNEGDA